MRRRRKQVGPLDILCSAFEALGDLLAQQDKSPISGAWKFAHGQRRFFWETALPQQYLVFSALIFLGALVLYIHLQDCLLRGQLALSRLRLALSLFCAYALLVFCIASSYRKRSGRLLRPMLIMRDVLWHLHSGSGQQPNPSRPSLIDLGPLALLQTALTVLAAPLFGRQRICLDIASVLLSLPSLRMQDLIARRKSRGLYIGFALVRKLVRLLTWQTLPIVMTIYAFSKQRPRSSEPSRQRRYNNCSIAAPDLAKADIKLPAFPLKGQCQSCLQRKQIIYDAHGYPLFLQ